MTKYKFDYISYAILILLTAILTYYSYNTTLGELNGFDSTFYLNLVVGNVGKDKFFTTNAYFGTESLLSVPTKYTFQTYYSFASCIVFIVQKVSNSILHINDYPGLSYIWIFQLLFNSLLSCIVINCFDEFGKNNKFLNIVISILVIFIFGRLYYCNVYGFYGNSYRQLAFAVFSFELIGYFKEKKTNKLALVFIPLLGAASFSSSGTFSLCFALFGLAFILVKYEDKLFKCYGVVLVAPLVQMFNVGFNFSVYKSLILSVCFCFVIFVLNDLLISLVRKYKKIIVILCAAIMCFISYKKTGILFNVGAFTDNLSEWSDMTLDYFDIGFNLSLANLYKILTIVPFIVFILSKRNSYSQFIWILIIVLFNPFCAGYFYVTVKVLYRAYDIFLNPVTLFFFINEIVELVNNRYINYGLSIVLLLLFSINANILKPTYYHGSFRPSENYDYVHKMEKSDFEMIEYLKYDIYENKIDNPFIVTGNKLTQSYLGVGNYLYGRTNPIRDKSENMIALYCMFYPREKYTMNTWPTNVDYSRLKEVILNTKVDYLVINKDYPYYDQEQDQTYDLFYRVYQDFPDENCYIKDGNSIFKFYNLQS